MKQIQEELGANPLKEEIEEKKAQLIALEERVKVYNEFLKGELPATKGMETTQNATTEGSSEDSEKKSRAPRSTKAEMAKRKVTSDKSKILKFIADA